jgi:hypothetical protein
MGALFVTLDKICYYFKKLTWDFFKISLTTETAYRWERVNVAADEEKIGIPWYITSNKKIAVINNQFKSMWKKPSCLFLFRLYILDRLNITARKETGA